MTQKINYYKKSLLEHKKKKGKLAIVSKFSLKNKTDLSVAYTPGVAEPCRYIAKNPDDAYKYTIKANSVAVVTNGSAVLGLGNIGAKAALPVMEGKAVLFKNFAGIDAYPICIDSQDPHEIIKTVKLISPGFGGINLEDIKAPECFLIEEQLKKDLDIPVFHDDQHGTAIVVLAALINSLKLTKKTKSEIKVVILGAGAAGIAICKIFLKDGIKNIIMLDSQGIIYQNRENLNFAKKEIAQITNINNIKGDLKEAMKGADVFIGVSGPDLVTFNMIKSMNKDAIVFAMANPVPEIMPDIAKKAGAKIVATGRSDFANQINNVLAFPGIFRGALDSRAKQITEPMKLAAAYALAKAVKKPAFNKIIPSVFDKNIVKKVAAAVKKCL